MRDSIRAQFAELSRNAPKIFLSSSYGVAWLCMSFSYVFFTYKLDTVTAYGDC